MAKNHKDKKEEDVRRRIIIRAAIPKAVLQTGLLVIKYLSYELYKVNFKNPQNIQSYPIPKPGDPGQPPEPEGDGD